MRKTKEILRLSLKEGWAQRDVARSTGVGKTTVQELLARVKELGLTWSQLELMREYEIVEKVLYPPIASGSVAKPTPDWAQIRMRLMEKGNTLALLWMDFKQEQPDGVQYSRFCDLYREWERGSHLVLRHHHVAGEKLFVDFSGLTVPWLDVRTSEIREAQIFVAALGASNFTFVKALPDQSLGSWIYAHVDAFDFIGGVPKAVVPDNLRSGISRACRYDPDVNPSYLSLAEHYSTAIIPTRARKPRDKAKVEVAVQIAQRWILAILRRQTFTSIEEINTAIIPLLERLNTKVMRHLGVSRRELWERFEKSALQPLPDVRFEMPAWKTAKVNIDYHVEFNRQYYSVPYRFVGTEVRIKVTRSLVEIFHQDEPIALHKRQEAVSGHHTTLPEHMPPKHAEHIKWTPERVLSWAQQSGKSTREICEHIIANRRHPEQGFRSCLGILRLGKKYSPERLESACGIALKMKSFRYRTILEILMSGKDKANPASEGTPAILVPIHENIRGSSYYQ